MYRLSIVSNWKQAVHYVGPITLLPLAFPPQRTDWNAVLCLRSDVPRAWLATGHVGRWPIAGGLSLWQVCLWINSRPWSNSPTPRCYVWLAVIRAEGANVTWVMWLNGAYGKLGDIPEYVALNRHRELCQCWHLFLPYLSDQNRHENFWTCTSTRSSYFCRLVTARKSSVASVILPSYRGLGPIRGNNVFGNPFV
jgi:hypothetical protein